MSKLYFGKIDVLKIDKDKLYKGKKGTYLDLTVWINDEPDTYGNTMSIQQSTKQDEEKIYLGEGKEHQRRAPEVNTGLPEEDSGDDSLPF
ncbi:hypothetical protein KAR91_64075 [Candidatus Pacearchaeota archaeon]|nr:hypothetical protein [Candidatus Pacearchaeota archaeon]